MKIETEYSVCLNKMNSGKEDFDQVSLPFMTPLAPAKPLCAPAFAPSTSWYAAQCVIGYLFPACVMQIP